MNQLTSPFEHTARIFIEPQLSHCIERQAWQAITFPISEESSESTLSFLPALAIIYISPLQSTQRKYIKLKTYIYILKYTLV